MYDGEFLNDLRNGVGMLAYPDGRIFKGKWLNDKEEG